MKFEEQYQTKRSPEKSPSAKTGLKNVLQVFNQANSLASKLQGKALCLFGMTRSGKSASFNILTNPKCLIGKKGIKPYYVFSDNILPNPEVIAVVQKGRNSVTMLPNITRILGNKYIEIIDFPGFGDSRTPIQFIQVEYINTKFINSLKKAQFILIFTQSSLKDEASTDFRDTLQKFIAFFDMNKFESEERKKLFRSISFCITSVDFKGESYQNVKQIFIQTIQCQLQEMNNAKTTQKSYYETAKELLQSIITNKSIILMELAQDKKPPQNNMISKLNMNQQCFFDVAAAARNEKLVSQYQKHYSKLQEHEQQEIDKIIKQRCQHFKYISQKMGNMLKYISQRIGERRIQVKIYLNQLTQIIKDFPYFKEEFIIQADKLYSVKDRLSCFDQLLSQRLEIKPFLDWKLQNIIYNQTQYFTKYLVDIFSDQLRTTKTLLLLSSTQSTQQVPIFNDIMIFIKKMLIQASICSKFSTHLRSYFSMKFSGELSFSKQVPKMQQIRRNFFNYFYSTKENEIFKNNYNIKQLNEINSICAQLKKDMKQLNPLIFYQISISLKSIILRIQKHSNNLNSNKYEKYLQLTFFILLQTIKVHICLTLVVLPEHQQQLNKLIKKQQYVIDQIGTIISNKFQKNKVLLQRHLQLKNAFSNIKIARSQGELKSCFVVALEAFYNLSQCFNITINQKIQMGLPITYSFKGNYEEQIDNIIKEYINFRKDDILEYNYRLPRPHHSSLLNQIKYCEDIERIVKGKKITLVMGKGLCGKSLHLNILKGKRIATNNQGKYDLQNRTMGSRINHSNTSDGFFNISPKNQQQMYVEVPDIFSTSIPSPFRFIRMCMVLNIVKSSRQWRVVLIEAQDDFKKQIFWEHIKDLLKLRIVSKNSISVIVSKKGMNKNETRTIINEIANQLGESKIQAQTVEALKVIVSN